MKNLVIAVLSLALLAALIALWRPQRGPAPGLPAAGAAAAIEAAPPAIRDGDSRRVRDAVARGELVPLESLLADAERRFPGRVLEVDLDDGEYEIEILAADGRVAELTYDARDGRLLGVEFEDD
ncbi:PepSY domain-containing protein [Arenimonas composti]|nr:PepSY domain-containing protein [Arenimonas composti]